MHWACQLTPNLTRTCGCCKDRRPPSDGRYVVYNGGKNQKWICFRCQPEVKP